MADLETAPIPEDELEPYVRAWLRQIGLILAKPTEEKVVRELMVLLTRFPGVQR